MKLLILGAVSSFTAAASHAAIGIGNGPAYRLFHDGETPSGNPAFATLLIASLLAVWGLYALAASGKIKPLPLMKPAIWGITALYLVRGLFLLPQLLGQNIFTDSSAVGAGDLLFSAAVLAIGAIHLAGLSQQR